MTTIIILGAFIGGLAIGVMVLYFMNRKPQSMILLQNQVQELVRMMDSRLSESTKVMQNQSRDTMDIIRSVTEHLTRVEESNKQVANFTDQLQSLQEILKNPKQRGVLGEYYLETILKNILPPGGYAMQYHGLGVDEKTGKPLIPDAVVFVRDKIIPVDSKFSLENYNRLVEERNMSERGRLEKLFVNDLKMRIQETAKYIKPEKGTMDFAFMFIPHEAIYYDLLVNKVGALQEETENLIQRAARTYHVIIVSPTSFLAYLQTVLQGLKALQIEESAKEIRTQVGKLSKHLTSYDDFMQSLGKHLGTTVGMYNDAYKEFKKIDKDVLRIGGEGMGVEVIQLDKPDSEA